MGQETKSKRKARGSKERQESQRLVLFAFEKEQLVLENRGGRGAGQVSVSGDWCPRWLPRGGAKFDREREKKLDRQGEQPWEEVRGKEKG